MYILKRIINSRWATEHFRWPQPRTRRYYWCIVFVIGLVSTVLGDIDVYNFALKTGASNIATRLAAVTFGQLLGFSLLGAYFLLMWALCYRMGTEVASDFRSFCRWVPYALQSILSGLAALIRVICRIPSGIAAFFRAIGRAFVWLAGRPAWWKGLSGKQKKGAIFSSVLVSVYAAAVVLFFPVAKHLSAHLPSWLSDGDTSIMQTLTIDFVLGSISFIFALTIFTIIVEAVAVYFARRKN